MTVDPPAQVAASLSHLRAAADEIVVAVDSRVDPELLGAYRDVADRLLRYEFRPPVDRPRAWLYAQCSSDWILSIDGDEVPSAAMIDALPHLVVATDVQQYAFPRRWLFPTLDTWIGELPWWPDFQVRLVRNDATLALRGGLHGGTVPAFPVLHVEAPIYHLDGILKSEAERRAKALEYEAQQPGARAFGGGPLNETLYLPERAELSDLRRVPSEDTTLIHAVVTADAGVAPADVPSLVATEDVDALAPSDGLADSAYRADLAPFDRDERMAPGERRPIYLRVTNAGSAWWPWGLEQAPSIRVSYHWRTLDGEMVEYEGDRSPLTARLAPGATQIVPVWVQAPSAAGSYLLEFDLVHEHVRWFEAPLTVVMDVGDRRC